MINEILETFYTNGLNISTKLISPKDYELMVKHYQESDLLSSMSKLLELENTKMYYDSHQITEDTPIISLKESMASTKNIKFFYKEYRDALL